MKRNEEEKRLNKAEKGMSTASLYINICFDRFFCPGCGDVPS